MSIPANTCLWCGLEHAAGAYCSFRKQQPTFRPRHRKSRASDVLHPRQLPLFAGLGSR